MDREVKQLKQSRIPIVKVRWNSRRGPEFIWEREDFFKSKYSHLFSNKKKASMKNRAPGRRSSKGRRIQEKKEGKDFDLFVGFHCVNLELRSFCDVEWRFVEGDCVMSGERTERWMRDDGMVAFSEEESLDVCERLLEGFGEGCEVEIVGWMERESGDQFVPSWRNWGVEVAIGGL
ncbi:hypothetical protein Tco_0264780 [Tanacetum coccineum]